MLNHLHLIVQAREGFKLSQIISDFKKHTTREILKLLEEDNHHRIKSLIKSSSSKKQGYQDQIWQRENYPELIETEEFLLNKVQYIYNNPIKKGYIAKAEDWLYSSVRNKFLDDHNVIEVDDREM